MKTNEQNKAQHTPGPWNRNIRFAGRCPIVFAGRNTHVACASQQDNPDETEANIDLIAAAPELLEALENAVISNFGRKGMLEPENLPGWARLACRVITKATGEAAP